MIETVQDRTLPLDRAQFLAAEPATGRVIIIAPTRAACETIEIGLTLHIETYLERTQGDKVRELARSGAGFGIIAGTGTGKTLAVRPIAEEILRAPLKIGVVNREREATPELPGYNVIVVTTGVARRWFQDGDIASKDTLVIDEIHQTSAELELCLALGKRAGCRFIWLSATVDPKFYRDYLGSSEVLQVFSFDPLKAADVRVINTDPPHFLGARFISRVIEEKRGVGVFLPTRAGVEEAANEVGARFPALNAAYYHGGEPVRVIRPFLDEGGATKPYMLAMTAAGQSALNVRGLDTVVIDDTRFSNVIERGRNVLTRGHLGPNEILQMAGRVHGRVEGGRVFILSDRPIEFSKLRPTAPEFQLAGDSERVALTCADMGVRADELPLPVPLDKASYRRAFRDLQTRGIITEEGRLTKYGRAVEALPVDRPWAELVVNAEPKLVPFLAVMSSIESLHRMTREERDIDDLIVAGSDHLTSYNLYAEAFERAGYIGEVYGLPRHFFEPQAMEKWASERGVLTKSIEDAALAMACVLRGVKMALPTKMPLVNDAMRRDFIELLARYMPFDLAIDEETADGQIARIGKTSVCGNRGPIAGDLRFFASRDGAPRAAIEGTQLPLPLLKKYAKRSASLLSYEPHSKPSPLVVKWQVAYHGFVFERDTQAIEEFPAELASQARRVLAESLARFEAKHAASHTNRAAIEEVRELHRRSGGETPRLDAAELAAHYEAMLEAQGVASMAEFRAARLPIRVEDFVSLQRHAELRALPSYFSIDGRKIEVRYEIEENRGVARLELSEKLARSLREEELPDFDRPLRFEVSRGARGSVRADSLAELKEKLQGPWTPDAGEFEVVAAPKHGTRRVVAKAKPRVFTGEEEELRGYVWPPP